MHDIFSSIEISIYDVFLSSLRWLIGLVIGSTLGLCLGVLSLLKTADVVQKPLGDFLRALPILGLVPFVQWFVGLNEFGKIGLIAWGVMFPVWISVRSAGKLSNLEIEAVLAAGRFSWRQKLRVYNGPRILLGFKTGVDIAVGLAWLAVVAAEMIATYSNGFWAGGLGFRLWQAYRTTNDLATASAALLVFGLLGILSSLLWRKIAPKLYCFLTYGADLPKERIS